MQIVAVFPIYKVDELHTNALCRKLSPTSGVPMTEFNRPEPPPSTSRLVSETSTPVWCIASILYSLLSSFHHFKWFFLQHKLQYRQRFVSKSPLDSITPDGTPYVVTGRFALTVLQVGRCLRTQYSPCVSEWYIHYTCSMRHHGRFHMYTVRHYSTLIRSS